MLSAIGLKMKVVDNVIRGDQAEPLYWDVNGVVVSGVCDAVKERHEFEEHRFVLETRGAMVWIDR
jgi:hypothetical protein